jgi:three-Cys-motif partner protein
MAGEPENIGRGQGKLFDGSPRLAMKSSPGFTRLIFCERNSKKASELAEDLSRNFPGDKRWQVVNGDCNVEIDGILNSLSNISWAPTFAFIDQQAAEVTWETLTKLSQFRVNKRKLKTELWILSSPAMIIKGVTGTHFESFALRVDKLYGDESWRRIASARREEKITAEQFRVEMVNLFRWNLEKILGYSKTVRIPMRMTNGIALYDMVFATDHPVGEKIMTRLYKNASEREPKMNTEARARAVNSRTKELLQMALFPVLPEQLVPFQFPKWEDSECWDPSKRPWW